MINQTNWNELKEIGSYLREVPFKVDRSSLYHAAELYAGYDPRQEESFAHCYDQLVYSHYIDKGKRPACAHEALARSLHDYHVSMALDRFLAAHDPRRCVGVMGGHALERTDEIYRSIVHISKQLTEHGFLMLSGGGPGAMEATHLGAWLAGHDDNDVRQALEMLEEAPAYTDSGWIASAFRVINRFPQERFESLGIPTWLYGHEPSTPFATHIAKLFENSIREDNILTFAYGGIIYTPGSAGTMQEIFQEAVQNHYLSFGFSSPMVFMGTHFWTKELPVYPLLQQLTQAGRYKNLLLSLTDDPQDIIRTIQQFREQG